MARPSSPSPPSSRPAARRAALAVALSALGALTACARGPATSPAATAVSAPSAARTSVVSAPPAAETSVVVSAPPAGKPSATTTPSPAPHGTRCRTFELRASVGRKDPGAGQENHPVVLTNTSTRTCTVYGFPGAAFVDASGRQLGPDPRREPESPARVRLAPGRSAWAGLSYARPEISGARTATPAALLVTPPDEREPLRVPWTAGKVPVGGNESRVSLTVLRPGSGA